MNWWAGPDVTVQDMRMVLLPDLRVCKGSMYRELGLQNHQVIGDWFPYGVAGPTVVWFGVCHNCGQRVASNSDTEFYWWPYRIVIAEEP